MHYSPVCNTNPAIYLAYLAATVIEHGAGFGVNQQKYGGRGVDKSRSGGGSDGVDVVGVFNKFLVEARANTLTMDVVAAIGGVDCRICGVTCIKHGGSSVPDVGVASVHDGDCLCGVDRCLYNECNGRSGSGRRDFPKGQRVVQHALGLSPVNSISLEPGLFSTGEREFSGSEAAGGGGRQFVSPKTLWNRAQRQRAKERKERKKESMKNRDVKVDLADAENPMDNHPYGFWKSCTDQTRDGLIASKAAMHMAENELKTEIARDKIRKLKSGFHTAQESVKMIEFARGLQAEDGERIYGWAKTVASSSAESLARTLPSSVPSFDSYVTRATAEEECRVRMLENKLEETVAKAKALQGTVERIELEGKAEKKILEATVSDLKKQLLKVKSENASAKVQKKSWGSEMDEFEFASKGPFTDTHPVAAKVIARRPGETRERHVQRANECLKKDGKRLISL